MAYKFNPFTGNFDIDNDIVLTDEQVQDIIGAILIDTTSINFTYNDAGNQITADVIPGGIDHGGLADLTADDHTQYALLANTRGVQTFAGQIIFDGGLKLNDDDLLTFGTDDDATIKWTSATSRLDFSKAPTTLAALGSEVFGSLNSPSAAEFDMIFGNGNTSTNDSTIGAMIFGYGNTASSTGGNFGQIMIGQSNSSAGDGSICIGSNNTMTSGASDGIAIGRGCTVSNSGIALGGGSTASGAFSFAMGAFANASGLNSAAVANLAQATANNAIAMGNSAQATAANAVAIGNGANCAHTNSLAIKGSTTANNQYVLGGGTGGLLNDLWLGGVSTTGAQTTKTINIVNRTGTNVAGNQFSINSGLGTGTGIPGPLVIFRGVVQASGTTAHTLAEAIRVGHLEMVINDTGLDYDMRVEGDNDANLLFCDAGNDRVGIGTNAPTAFLHLKAGTATANTAPLKFTSGTNLTTPEAGAVEYDGKILYFTKVATRRRVVLANNTITSPTTVANTTTETTLFTTTLTANSISVADLFKVYAYGHYSTANGSDTFTIRFKIGSTTILSYTSTAANVTNTAWHAMFTSTVRTIGAGGTFIAFAEGDTNGVNTDIANTSTTAIDTTASNTFTVTVQWSNADAGNTITVQQAYDKVL